MLSNQVSRPLVNRIEVAANQDVISLRLGMKAKPMVAECIIAIEDPLQLEDIINELDDWKVGIALFKSIQSSAHPLFDEIAQSTNLVVRWLRVAPTDKGERFPQSLDS